ncbi:23S rRNA (adenine(2030)-N(6))-methyltransferase RlmJ [Emcibacter sp. SYSU 3D8]|uniref:23S rRNA (adenine(2030)-N(6))-methyltransferase RlmJ n=1 Tax=Emcibacter sp. SYSU 3D8 TaxID=3133969 RepID=UPI0031FEB9F8
MLSYRHGFHAGNHADVLKHGICAFIARYLLRKDTPVLFLDTHAGAGRYDLQAPEAEKTGEFRAGIGRLMPEAADAPELLTDYLAQVRSLNADDSLRIYPGSPSLIMALMRPQDRALFYELHPSDEARLSQFVSGRRRVRVEKADGLRNLIAHMPPPERRALCLIDPSYEIKTDYALVATAVSQAWKKFPGGTYVWWYPVIDRTRVRAMEVAMRAAGLRKTYRVEFCMEPDTAERGMTGSGLFIVNPPYTLPAAVDAALPWLVEKLGAQGPTQAGWLFPE